MWRDPATGFLRTAVSPPFAGSPVEIVRIELPAGASAAYDAQPHAHHGQHVLVIGGRLTLTVAEERFALEPWDCLFMRMGEPVTFANEQAEPCHYLIVLNLTA